jgi:pyridoxal phosphate enzyme (YggS family)
MTIAENINDIRERIEKAAARSGRKPESVRLMGVSKFHSAAEIEEALKAGLSLFGESRVQETLGKFPQIRKTCKLELHMIGSLQRNKAKSAIELFDCIQSVDRDDLLRALGTTIDGSDESGRRENPLKILLEMHTGEESKSGYPDVDSLCKAAELALSFPGIRLSGLMTMAPFTTDTARIRESFRTLSRARDFLASRFPEADFSCLSMGMSNDFEIAIEEGSSLVRIGTAIFGERAT